MGIKFQFIPKTIPKITTTLTEHRYHVRLYVYDPG